VGCSSGHRHFFERTEPFEELAVFAVKPSPQLEVVALQRGKTIVVEVTGEVDLISAAAMEDRLAQALSEAPETVVADLTGVEFLDSTGIHILLRAAARANDHAIKMVVVRPAGAAATILDICRLSELLPVVSPDRRL
jgi:anti-sigma B factor antagonist